LSNSESNENKKLNTKSNLMKTLAIVLLSACVAAALALYFAGRKLQPAASPTPVPAEVTETEPQKTQPAPTRAAAKPASPVQSANSAVAQRAATPSQATTAPAPATGSPVFSQAIESLVSPNVTYLQKQQAWQHLRESGKLDQAIVELERRAAAEPNSAAYPAAIGQACLHKAGTIQDVREQGVLGLKADASFEAALNNDSSNWEARFWKATAMSYWPPQLNKGKEVLEQFLELVRQQEAQPTQPQFAQTYVLLGEQYDKQGHPDYAAEIWQRGLTLFPSDSALQQKAAKPAVAEKN
jgi:tetratricopeptide (TPR) repeat protein